MKKFILGITVLSLLFSLCAVSLLADDGVEVDADDLFGFGGGDGETTADITEAAPPEPDNDGTEGADISGDAPIDTASSGGEGTKSGCGAFIGVSVTSAAVAAGCAVLILKKKN